MKKIKIIIALFIVLSLGFAACMEDGDFDTDKISLKELSPKFLIPLIQDTLTLNSQPNISHDHDTSVIFYNIDNIHLPAKDDWFAVPDVNENLPIYYPSSATIVDLDETFSLSFPLLSGSDSRELDSLLCSSLPVKLDFTGLPQLDLVEVAFPQILVNGQPYKQNVLTANALPGTYTINVPACKIVPKDKKYLEIQVRLKGRIYASFNANLNVQIQNIQNYYTALFGYFGQETVEVKDSIVLDIMDDLNITAEVLEFDILKIATSIQNSMGIPFRLILKSITAYDKNGQPIDTETPNKSVDILAPGYTDMNRTAFTEKFIQCNGFGSILNKETRKVVFSFDCISNPSGNPRNFLTATDFIQAAVSVRIPLVLKAQQLKLQDTISINMTSVSLQELTLQMHYKNRIPAKITLNVELLDENDAPFATLIGNLTIEKPVDTETDLKQTLPISKDLFEKLKKSTLALATVDIDTGTTDYVIFKSDNYLTMKIGAAAKFTYDDLFKNED